MVRRPSLLAVLLMALVASLVALPASADRGPEYSFDPAAPLRSGSLDSITMEGADTVVGEIAGAGYVGQRPEDWNGELIVWAHGYRGEPEEGATRLYVDPPPVREWLLDKGYAWIASSYRRNSYDPGAGVLDTKNATQRAGQLWGQPERTYLAGASMGGHVTAAAIEQFPNLYDGALPACGVLGDVELFDYFLDYNLGAAAFAGLDAGDLAYPDTDWVDGEVVDIKQALSFYDEAPDATIDQWAVGGTVLSGGVDLLTPEGDGFKDFVEVGSGGERGAIYDLAWDFWHVLAGPNFFFDLGEGTGTIAHRAGVVGQNTDVTYGDEYGSEFAFLDDAILRVDGADRVRKAQGHKPSPIIEGDPRIPVLTIHTIGDLFVPIEMEQIYAREVAANGNSDLLVQRAIRDVGHCTFSDAEWVQSFSDLFEWVENGVRPAGENLVEDISDADLGCAFTINDATVTPLRYLVPGCPPSP